jgi:hypothetical protein
MVFPGPQPEQLERSYCSAMIQIPDHEKATRLCCLPLRLGVFRKNSYTREAEARTICRTETFLVADIRTKFLSD